MAKRKQKSRTDRQRSESPAPSHHCACSNIASGRNLVVCIDDTSNQSNQKNSNTFRLFRLLRKDDKDGEQLILYNCGRQVIENGIESAISGNLESIVMKAYRWLSEHYQEGDRIFLFGFANGAYRVRVLSAMVEKVGLIPKGNEARIPFIYKLYADNHSGGAEAPASGGSSLKKSTNPKPSWFKRTFMKKRKGESNARSQEGSLHSNSTKKRFNQTEERTERAVHGVSTSTPKTMAQDFKETHSRDVKVHFVGAWETVSFGKSLPGTIEGMNQVCYFRHALALDEDNVKLLPEYALGDKSNEDASGCIKEVWFVGTHFDIGGGNMESPTWNLSLPSLRWMVSEATTAGVHFSPLTRDLTNCEIIDVQESLRHTSIKPHLGRPRQIQKGQKVHASLLNTRHSYIPKASLEGRRDWDSLLATSLAQAENDPLFETDRFDACHVLVARFIEERNSLEKKQLLKEMKVRASEDEARPTIASALSQQYEQLLETSGDMLQDIARLIAAIWDDTPQESLPAIQSLHKRTLSLIATLLDGTSKDRRIGRRLLLALSDRCIEELVGHTDRVFPVAFSPDGSHVISGSDDGTLRIWNRSTGKTVGSLEGHTQFVRSVAFSPDGRRVASGSDDETIRIWDVSTGRIFRQPLEGHAGPVRSVVFSMDGSRLVSGSEDGTIRIWDVSTGKMMGIPLEGHIGQVLSVTFSSNGRLVASGSNDRTIRIWDALTGKMLGPPLVGHTSNVNSVAFSPNGRHLVSGSDDCTIRIWDVSTGKPVGGPLEGHTSLVRSVAFSPDSSCVVSGSSDCIRIWEASTGKMMGKPLEGHIGTVWSVAFSKGGARVVNFNLSQHL